jgi:hypothetical protein
MSPAPRRKLDPASSAGRSLSTTCCLLRVGGGQSDECAASVAAAGSPPPPQAAKKRFRSSLSAVSSARELFALERRDVDRRENLLHVRRRFTGGVLKEGGKTDGSVRAVPRSYGRGEVQAPRMGTRLTRLRVPHRRLYHCRHTFATWAIESGVFWDPRTRTAISLGGRGPGTTDRSELGGYYDQGSAGYRDDLRSRS